MKNAPTPQVETVLTDLRALIEEARQRVAQTANSTLTRLHWQVGQRILRKVLQGQRARYGEEILPTLSAKLVPDELPLNEGNNPNGQDPLPVNKDHGGQSS